MNRARPSRRGDGAYGLQPLRGGGQPMALNLVQHRRDASVWDRHGDRWLIAVLAGAFLVSGFRRRSKAVLLLVLGGGCLAWWAAAGADERRTHKGRLRAAWPARQGAGGQVHEGAEG